MLTLTLTLALPLTLTRTLILALIPALTLTPILTLTPSPSPSPSPSLTLPLPITRSVADFDPLATAIQIATELAISGDLARRARVLSNSNLLGWLHFSSQTSAGALPREGHGRAQDTRGYAHALLQCDGLPGGAAAQQRA